MAPTARPERLIVTSLMVKLIAALILVLSIGINYSAAGAIITFLDFEKSTLFSTTFLTPTAEIIP